MSRFVRGAVTLLAIAIAIAIALAPTLAWPAAAPAPRIVVDAFEDTTGWSAHPADGVELSLHSDPGVHGRALRLDYNFVKGGGYAVARKAFDVPLPANYRFRLAVRGASGPQNFEFKLIDSTGSNVWWSNRRDFVFPSEWDSITTKKRQISFAWGPIGGGDLKRVAAIEFAVTAGSGGKGSVWLDELVLEPLPLPAAVPPRPVASATSARAGGAASLAVDASSKTAWRSSPGDAQPALTLDLGGDREMSGVVLEWVPGRASADYAIEISDDGERWRTVREVVGGNGGRDPLFLPETETRYLRVASRAAVGPGGVSLAQVTIQPPSWAPALSDFFMRIARMAPRGVYPRALWGEQSYWTVLGADADAVEVLFDEDMRLEIDKGGWSIEPFVSVDGKLLDWTTPQRTQGLAFPWRPGVSQKWPSIQLYAGAFVAGDSSNATLRASYRVVNPGPKARRVALDLALRPFQVNPPAQFLNSPGGVATVSTIARDGERVTVNGSHDVILITPPTAFGATTFDGGDVVADFLSKGRLPQAQEVKDSFAHASGVLRYSFDMPARSSQFVELAVPLHGRPEGALKSLNYAFMQADKSWSEHRRGGPIIQLPPSGNEILETFWAQLVYVRINRDGAGVQPGSRSYERSWIRDGALTSSAMLRAGQSDVPREFAEWFAPYQYDDGTVPCCVDRRGADPVPEHDSHGELIFLIAEVTRYTGDRAFAGRMWPYVVKAADHLDSLRAQRRTAEWRTPENAPYFGILPPSISHEGYSAKPMHSYWDDFFALRGYKDAVYLADLTGHQAERIRFAASRDTFAHDFAASIKAAMAAHNIDYVPGCADLGDYDATSTTIALSPAEAESVTTSAALVRTFEGYWEYFKRRRDGKEAWDAFTPYELRNVGAFVRLGWRDRAHELLDWFLQYRRPKGFRHWAEVVDHDPRKQRFIGDMPHTWVGSDYVRSVLDMFVYPTEDSALVVGAGVPREWVSEAPGVRVTRLPTPIGTISYTMRAEGSSVLVTLEGARNPPGGILLRPPTLGVAWRRVTVGGADAPLDSEGGVLVRTLPAQVVFLP